MSDKKDNKPKKKVRLDLSITAKAMPKKPEKPTIIKSEAKKDQ